MVENINLLGLHKAFDVTLNLDYRGPLYMIIEGRGVYKETALSVRWLSLSVIEMLSGYPRNIVNCHHTEC